MTKKNILMGLSIIGIGISLYLTYAKLTHTGIVCGNLGCNIVQNSEYSQIYGIPVAVLGLLYYFVLFALVYGNKQNLVNLALVAGLLFSAWLTYLELYVINAICAWCVGSAVVVVVMTVVQLFLPHKKATTEGNA